MRRSEKITSSAVTGLPLWNSMPCLSRTVQASGLLPTGSIDSASSICSCEKSGVRTASDSYKFHWRMMSGSVVGWCASIVSFAPPPVAPTRRTPPVRSFCCAGAVAEPVEPPPPPPPLLPHAARRPLANSTAPPAIARRSASRRGMSSNQADLASLLMLVLLVIEASGCERCRDRGAWLRARPPPSPWDRRGGLGSHIPESLQPGCNSTATAPSLGVCAGGHNPRITGDRDLRDGWLVRTPIAHRGLHATLEGRPENSLAAFAHCCQLGFPAELDVRLTRDGEVVVFHDHALKRLTGAAGRVEERDAAELRALRLLGTRERVPLLGEVLELVGGRVPLLIELKSGAPPTALGLA